MDKRFGNDYKRPYSTRLNNIKSVNGKSGGGSSSSSSNSNNPFVNSPFSTSRYGNFSSSSSNNSFAYNRNNAASSSSSSSTTNSSSSSSSNNNNVGRMQTREEIDNYKYSWRNEAYRNKFIQQLRCIVDDEHLASNNPADEGYLSSA